MSEENYPQPVNLPSPVIEEFDDLPVQASLKASQRYAAIIDFCKHHLKYGVHYSVLPAEEWKIKDKTSGKLKSTDEIMNDPSIKKFMTEPGADMLNMSWMVRPRFEIQESITDFTTPRFYYRYKCILESPNGRPLVEAEGSASSEEAGFSTRWFSEEEIRSHPDLKNLNLDTLRKREFGWGKYAKWKYACKNPDLSDQMHNVNVRAQKRSKVKATRMLYAIGDLFNQPMDDWDEPKDMEPVAPEDQEPEAPKQAEKQKNTEAPKKVLELQRLFQDRCKHHGIMEKADLDEQLAKLWGDTELTGWKDVSSADRARLVTEWIDRSLPADAPRPGKMF